jgi:hypothetical protein
MMNTKNKQAALLAGLALVALSNTAQAQTVAAGRYVLQNANSGKCFDIRASSLNNGAALRKPKLNASN